ncbi:hypothetical protein HHK36_017618 [Tetracentron sinense]|uniref:Thioredoxin domain-containing protein n=1 Tax=Tetracentron sinense TaxID=13715 RepID=A0A834Z351_TETSI|nr:hypothetical protein HHK36_017618 [Tetracentron sinense]
MVATDYCRWRYRMGGSCAGRVAFFVLGHRWQGSFSKTRGGRRLDGVFVLDREVGRLPSLIGDGSGLPVIASEILQAGGSFLDIKLSFGEQAAKTIIGPNDGGIVLGAKENKLLSSFDAGELDEGRRAQWRFLNIIFVSLKVNGEYLDRALSSSQRNSYTAVLFYASWCPFSRGARSKFDVLNSMFPQIRHLAIEQSSALPSVFSRHGIHSLPSIIMVNQTSRVLYFGPKDLCSFIHFYKRITGLEPVQYFAEDQTSSLESSEKPLLQPWNGSSLKEMFTREPYLVLSVLFLCFRAFLYLFPQMLSRLRAFWVSYVPHLNMGIFGETSLLLGRVLHVIDVKRVCHKLRLCKSRNFEKGAKNARVWASSLASVSLGEAYSSRPSSSGGS